MIFQEYGKSVRILDVILHENSMSTRDTRYRDSPGYSSVPHVSWSISSSITAMIFAFSHSVQFKKRLHTALTEIFHILRWLRWYYSNKHSSTKGQFWITLSWSLHLVLFLHWLHCSCVFSMAKPAKLLLLRSSSFDYVVTKYFILKSKCK